jgi:N-acetylmuramoyl-L-alanine amidase
LAPTNKKCWHAGTSEYKGLVGLNAYTIGIELDNFGRLNQTADGGWITYFGRKVDPSEVLVATHKHGGKASGWHIYTEAQLDSLEELGLALFDFYDLEDAIGHEDIAVGRKSDPGPAFPMDSFKSKMHGRENENIKDST